MLQNLRDKAQGWIAWVIIGMIGITFVLFGTGSIFQKGSSQRIVATIGDNKISAEELDVLYKRFLSQPGSESLSQLDPVFVKKELLQSLIDEKILIQTATKMGMRISGPTIVSALSSIPLFLENGQFSPELYARFLANSRYSDQSFKTLLQENMLKQQLQQGIMQTSFALPSDVHEFVKYLQQSRDIRYLLINRAPFAKDVKLTDEEIKQYYNNHLKDFLTENKVGLEYIHLSAQDLMKKYQPTDEEMKNFYKENASAFSDPERVKVAHILIALPKSANQQAKEKAQEKIKEIQAKLKAGQSFADLAKEYSDDKVSSPKGGELDWLIKGEMVPEFENGAFALNKAGEVSAPVQTEFGIHLIKLIEKQPAKERSYDTVKNEIMTKMKEQWAEEQLATLADQLNDLTYDHPDTLQVAADKLGLTIQATDLFSQQQGPKDPLLQNPTVINAAFSPAVKDDKNNSDLIKLDDQNYIVFRVARNIASKQKPLDEVQPQIEKMLIDQKSDQLAKENADKQLQAMLKLNADQLKANYSFEEKTNLTRQNNTVNAALLESAFSLPDPQAGEIKHDLTVVHLDNGDYAILWLTDIKNGNANRLSREDEQNFQSQITKHLGELEYALFANDLAQHAKVVKHLDNI